MDSGRYGKASETTALVILIAVEDQRQSTSPTAYGYHPPHCPLPHKQMLMYTWPRRETMVAAEDTVFRAIAHPARRKILHLLSLSDRSVKELTASFAISQPAISQHLRELRGARLVTAKKVGIEHRYRLTGSPLRTVHDWASSYKRFFDPAGHAWALTASPGKRRLADSPASKEAKREATHGH